MKNFALVMGLLFGSAGAHTYLKSGQVAPAPVRKLFSYVHTICMLIQQECFGKGIINKCIKCKNCAASA